MSRISVIIPAFNYGKFLAEAIESVLAQTHSDWECIVVDDGSTDDTSEVARRYSERDARIRVLVQENAGPSAARNAAFRVMTGTYVQFLDADDKLARDKLALHSRFLDEHPQIDLVYGPCTFFRTDAPDQVLHSLHGHLSRSMHPKIYGDALETLQDFNITPSAAVLFRRSVVDRAGEFVPESRGSEDWDFWLRAAIAGCAMTYLESGTVAFLRTHDTSASRSTERMMRGLIAAAQAFPRTRAAAAWHDPAPPRIYGVALGIDLIERGKRREGVRRIWQAARGARSTLTRIRWGVYALAGAVLPRRLFMRVVMIPMPERGLEWMRRLSGRR